MQKFLSVSVAALLLIGCGGLTLLIEPSPVPLLEPSLTASPLPSPLAPLETVTALPPPSPTDTSTAAPSPTLTPAPTLEPQWYMQGPGEVIVPILLYHHIAVSQSENIYYISPFAFEQQMNLLREWGYSTISVEWMVRAINEGAQMPPKPVIITFDDGSETVYTTALPIMQKYNFTGTTYIVYNYIGTLSYMQPDQIRALYASGWEIGSHGLSHADLTERSDRQRQEIVESRRKLESMLGLPVLSFAYPFGAYNEESVHYAHFAGYIAGLGLGNESLQGSQNLFYLYRQAVKGSDDLRRFALLLPWREDLEQLPAITVVP